MDGLKMMTDEEAEVARLLAQPYARVVIPDIDDGGYTAYILEFPGCVAEGESIEETYGALERAAESWLLACIDQGMKVPQPLDSGQSSGRFALRLPRGLHARANAAAAMDGVSLNQFIVAAVAERLGERRAQGRILAALEQLLIRDKALSPTG